MFLLTLSSVPTFRKGYFNFSIKVMMETTRPLTLAVLCHLMIYARYLRTYTRVVYRSLQIYTKASILQVMIKVKPKTNTSTSTYMTNGQKIVITHSQPRRPAKFKTVSCD